MLPQVFSSSAKFSVLQLLCCLSIPISLRKIARFCNLPVRSVQLALASLQDQCVIDSTKEGNQKKFALRPDSEFYEAIRAVFDSLQRVPASSSDRYRVRDGGAVLEFIRQARSIAPKGNP
jgi:predicted transcriptional regulator